MALADIRQPSDLRGLNSQQLAELSSEIRDFIVAAVAETGGHLGSNLGAVELTLALHRVFESPRDAILWDTGHQAYVHKIVTGRRGGFSQLRQAGGLSGYPSREESVHDFIENSHASTVLSYAHGMAVARDKGQLPDRRHVVAVIGDGSLTGGMAYEALNNLGHSKSRVIIVLNDNGRSYAPTVSNLVGAPNPLEEPTEHPRPKGRLTSRLTRAFTNVRLNPVYVRRQRRLEQWLYELPYVGPQAERGLEAIKAGIREFLQPTAFFEALGVRYVGPVDGHDIATFLNRAWDQLVYDVALHRLPVIFCLDRAGVTGDDGPSHHGVYDMALLSKVPGMRVLAPSSAQDLQQMLHDALSLADTGPVVIRYPKGNARQVAEHEIGSGLSARRMTSDPGKGLCILAVGKMVAAAEQMVAALARENVSATLWDVRSCVPADDAMIRDAAAHRRVITIEDGVRDGGIGFLLADAITTVAPVSPPNIRVLGLPTKFVPHAKPDTILAKFGLDAAGLERTAREMLAQ
ncbi:MAG: 1-deoxy-D-xylulose-5-phosphate synthase [Acidimicrobiia bacterium]|nr:1-deoxy-D-xylulose-5-phosphate synthase [Acidimicrobiia bacterium]